MKLQEGTYYGGKGASGAYQAIINQIPPHANYIEPFAGLASIFFKLEYLFEEVWLFEKDPVVIKALVQRINKVYDDEGDMYFDVNVKNECGLAYLKSLVAKGDKDWNLDGTVIYCDPPYPLSTRKSSRLRYSCEWTDQDHIDFIDTAVALGKFETNTYILISSYGNPIYDAALSSWRKIEFTVQSRHGQRTEALYMNYPEPTELANYKYLGANYRDRAAIKKRIQSHMAAYNRMTPREQNLFLRNIHAPQNSLKPLPF